MMELKRILLDRILPASPKALGFMVIGAVFAWVECKTENPILDRKNNEDTIEATSSETLSPVMAQLVQIYKETRK